MSEPTGGVTVAWAESTPFERVTGSVTVAPVPLLVNVIWGSGRVLGAYVLGVSVAVSVSGVPPSTVDLVGSGLELRPTFVGIGVAFVYVVVLDVEP